MPVVDTALVVGGGAAGSAAAILLAEAGVEVDLVELAAEVSALGSGITLQGNALRVLRRLGVLDECSALGYQCSGLLVRAADPAATVLATLEDLPFGGTDLPGTMGMYRPDLARILMARAGDAGVTTRFATTLEALTQDHDGVDVRFSDGSTRRYDLVVGADGVRSRTRDLAGVSLDTRAIGMGAWRMFGPRPTDVTTAQLFFGGPCYIAGITPTGPDSAYWYLVEDARDRTEQTPEQQLDAFRELSRAYHGPWDEARDRFDDPTRLNYTWFETHLLEAPWHRGRVVLIGDAVHVCPPTIAQGAAAALEDAAVLGELLAGAGPVEDALAAFSTRRHDRVRTVVEASLQMAQWNLDHVQGDVPGLTRRIAELVAQPA